MSMQDPGLNFMSVVYRFKYKPVLYDYIMAPDNTIKEEMLA